MVTKKAQPPTLPLQKRWFRVETAADGSILSCEEVASKGAKGGHVRFYEAADAADACAQAKAWLKSWYLKRERLNVAEYRRWLADPDLSGPAAREALISAEKRVQSLESDKCMVCASAPSVDGVRCKACLENHVAAARIRRYEKPRTAAQLAGDAKRTAKLKETGANRRRARLDFELAAGLTTESKRWLREIELFDQWGAEEYRNDLVRRFCRAGGDVRLVQGTAFKSTATARRRSTDCASKSAAKAPAGKRRRAA